MSKTCQRCGTSLQENDFLCPKCGAIYGEPTYEAPKAAEKPAPAAQKRGRRFALFGGIALLIALACLLIWNPFQPEATTPSTSHTQPSTSAVPTPPPTTLPPTVPTTVPPTTLPSDQKQLNWTMDAKVVRPDGRLVSNTTVMISGLIVTEEDAAATLSLYIYFLPTFRYKASDSGQQKYPVKIGPGDIVPYYISCAYFYNRMNNVPDFITFAIDPEAECAIFILPEDPEQYLVCSTDADVNVEEVLAHFQTFLDMYT